MNIFFPIKPNKTRNKSNQTELTIAWVWSAIYLFSLKMYAYFQAVLTVQKI